MKKVLLLLLFCLSIRMVSAQTHIGGKVVDSRGEELPFVYILVNGQTDRIFSTELNGSFLIPYDKEITSLSFRFIGFSDKVVPISGPQLGLVVVLEASAYTLDEAVVFGGENPAHRIIRLALANRNENNPLKLPAYRYQAFTKMTLKMQTSEGTSVMQELNRNSKNPKNTAQDDGARFDSLHLFLMETLSLHSRQRPQKKREEILRHRTSGFQEPWFVGLATQLQPFSFYEDEFPFLEKRYVNPISPGSTNRYRFRLEETFIDGADSIFLITFQPKDNSSFIGLKGSLHIHSSGYAIRHLIAESAEKEQVAFHIDQQYTRTDSGQWFPEQLSLVLDVGSSPGSGLSMRLSSRTYIDSIDLQPTFSRGYFAGSESYTLDKEINKKDSLLDQFRREEISNADSLTYQFWDSLGQANNLDTKIKLLNSFTEGSLPFGKVDVVLGDLFRYSEFEGLNLGLGLRTNQTLSEYFSLYGYGAYAFRAKEWKYGGVLSIYPTKKKKFELGLQYRYDLTEPATFDFPVKRHLINRRYFAERMDRERLIGGYIKGETLRGLQVRFAVEQQQRTPFYDFAYMPDTDNPGVRSFSFTETDLYLRYSIGSSKFSFLGIEMESSSKFPTLQLRLTKGWKSWWQGEYDYWRVHGALEYRWNNSRLGSSWFYLEGSYVSPNAPYPKLFTPIGTGAGWSIMSLQSAFETMQPYEFASDRSAHFYWEHTFNRLTKKSRFFQPQPALIHRMGWGTAPRVDLNDIPGFQTMEKGFYESGLAIHSLLRFNYVNLAYISLGLKAVYRYGPYQLDKPIDNLAMRLTLQITR
jgi:hypothetical protein